MRTAACTMVVLGLWFGDPARRDPSSTVVTVKVGQNCTSFDWPVRPGDNLPANVPARTRAIASLCDHKDLGPLIANSSGAFDVRLDGVIETNTYNKTLNGRRWNEFATLVWPGSGAAIRVDQIGAVQTQPADLLANQPHLKQGIDRILALLKQLTWPAKTVLDVGVDKSGVVQWLWPMFSDTETRDRLFKGCADAFWDWPYENVLLCAASVAFDSQIRSRQ